MTPSVDRLIAPPASTDGHPINLVALIIGVVIVFILCGIIWTWYQRRQ